MTSTPQDYLGFGIHQGIMLYRCSLQLPYEICRLAPFDSYPDLRSQGDRFLYDNGPVIVRADNRAFLVLGGQSFEDFSDQGRIHVIFDGILQLC